MEENPPNGKKGPFLDLPNGGGGNRRPRDARNSQTVRAVTRTYANFPL